MSKLKFRRITEAIEVEGATLIGTSKGFDLFDIHTYAAAQQFQTPEGRLAGQHWTRDEATFNANINDQLHFYIFVEENTNIARCGVVKSETTESTVSFLPINPADSYNLSIHFNFQLEMADNNSSEIPANCTLPLYLIPNMRLTSYENDDGIIRFGGGREQGTITALLPQLTERTEIEELELSANQSNIPAHMTDFGLTVKEITLPLSIFIANYHDYCLFGVTDNIYYGGSEPEEISNLVNPANDVTIRARWGLSEDQLAELDRQDAERLQQQEEARRHEEEERRRAEEEERRRLERAQNMFEYKVVRQPITYKENGQIKRKYKKEITIFGLNGPQNELLAVLQIPREINNLPVTRIAPYAFFDTGSKIRSFEIPNTLREIGQGAFGGIDGMCYVRRRQCVAGDCIIGKYNPAIPKDQKLKIGDVLDDEH